MTAVTAYVTADRRGQRYVLADGSLDDAQASGRWLATTEPVEVRQ